MLYVTYTLNFLLMIALPIVLGVFLARRLRLRWALFGAGAVVFIASQVVHIPLNLGLTALFDRGFLPAPPEAWQLPFNAAVLGLTAGLSEELARYLAYRYWLRGARTWGQALMFGAGHGGVEAIILGLLAAIGAGQIFVLRQMDLDALPLTAEQLAQVEQALAQAWGVPWHFPLLGAVERAFALALQLALAVLVLQAFTRRGGWLWLGAAVLWHALVDGLAVYALGRWGPYWAEAVIGGVAAISLAIIFALRRGEPAVMPPAVEGQSGEGAATPAGPPTPPAQGEVRQALADQPGEAALERTRHEQ